MSTIRMFPLCFIIITANCKSFATQLLNCWLIQRRSSSNRGHEGACGLVDCRYLNTYVVAILFLHLILSWVSYKCERYHYYPNMVLNMITKGQITLLRN